MSATTSTEMYDNSYGATSMMITYWPIILGAGLGLILIGIVFLILWKTGTLRKLRPYQRHQPETNRQMVSLSQVVGLEMAQ